MENYETVEILRNNKDFHFRKTVTIKSLLFHLQKPEMGEEYKKPNKQQGNKLKYRKVCMSVS